MATKKKLMTAEELFMLPDTGCRRELLDGVLVEMSPTGGPHARVMIRTGQIFLNYLDGKDLGVVWGGDPGFILRRHPDHVLAPDVCFIASGRLPAEENQTGYLELVPDFIIEIVSPGDSPREVREKIEEWLQAGARLVWAMYPETRSIVAYRGLDSARTYSESDTIDAEPVLPGFSARVADFFS